ncbi:hypothetical protein JG687_00009114 [Phytophthora cactorum]|uniref:Uncharacterized protein n=1 Tax=Phytophthora cactorum TaxID=29920 RepID=A0A8T1UFJ0_9STRA|nr:hypothetical protein JG687_00009114 [Phytophthora cactorum]
MNLLNTIQNDVLKQKEEEAQNHFERVVDVQEEALHRAITMWDSKAVKVSCTKANVDFQPGAVYVFRKVDGASFYVDIAKANVQYDLVMTLAWRWDEPRDAVSTRSKRGDPQRA